MADLVMKAHDTYPPYVSVLYDTTLSSPGVPMDLSTATAIKLLMKGTSVLVTGTMAKLTVVTPTGNVQTGSNIVTSLSATTSIVEGSSVYAPGIFPAGAIVGEVDTSSIVLITVANGVASPANALVTQSAQSLTINQGTVQYSWATGDLAVVDTYQVEHEITWPGGIQTVPNGGYRTLQVLADLEGA